MIANPSLKDVGIGVREGDEPRLHLMASRCADARKETVALSGEIVSTPHVRDDGSIEITAFDRSRITWIDKRPSGGMVNLEHWVENGDGSILRTQLRFPRLSSPEALAPQSLHDLSTLLSIGEQVCRSATGQADDRLRTVRQVMDLMLESDPRRHILSTPTPWSPMVLHLAPDENGEPSRIDPGAWAMLESYCPETLHVIDLATSPGTTKILLTAARIDVGGDGEIDTVASLRALSEVEAS